MNQPTIAAISTPMSAGAIGLVRMSGPEAKAIAAAVFRPIGKRTMQTVPGFSAIYGHIVDGEETVDEVVVYVYTAPRSYTGEDVVEFSCHGGPWLLSRVLRLLLDHGAVPAQAGEFTKRAFLAGKMDLTPGRSGDGPHLRFRGGCQPSCHGGPEGASLQKDPGRLCRPHPAGCPHERLGGLP